MKSLLAVPVLLIVTLAGKSAAQSDLVNSGNAPTPAPAAGSAQASQGHVTLTVNVSTLTENNQPVEVTYSGVNAPTDAGVSHVCSWSCYVSQRALTTYCNSAKSVRFTLVVIFAMLGPADVVGLYFADGSADATRPLKYKWARTSPGYTTTGSGSLTYASVVRCSLHLPRSATIGFSKRKVNVNVCKLRVFKLYPSCKLLQALFMLLRL